ncbi:MAG: HAMP domain-containing histidine kinase [Thaumarchaeota archaeon]|nr:HAMP domain-containing histidine kinase [Nitrososphaerota archaeon]
MNKINENNIQEIPEIITKVDVDEIEIKKEAIQLDIREKIHELLKAERLAVLGEFSARLNHDLRNPLAIIKNAASMIKDKELTPEQKSNQCEAIDRAIFRITHQIEDVLDFVELQNLEIRLCSISEIIENAWSEIRFPKNKTELHVKCNRDTRIQCDLEQLKIAFKNILLNSVQGMNYQGKIDVTITDATGFIKIEIKDNGPGISENILPKIFDPLFTTKQIGTGLGLVSCKNIIEGHKGRISVDSKKDIGTRFIIELPKNLYEVFAKHSEIKSQNS